MDRLSGSTPERLSMTSLATPTPVNQAPRKTVGPQGPRTPRFTITFPPFVPEPIFYERIIPFVRSVRPFIHDIYITCRIPPFVGDAMGHPVSAQRHERAIEMAFDLHKATGVPLSGTFNNKFISPNRNNYQTFVTNFRPLYERGIRNITIPFNGWLALGIKREFPGLYVKNTVLQRVRTPNEVYRAAELGYDYLNLDRDLMRDIQGLTAARKAVDLYQQRTGRSVVLSLLWNEHCLGNCPYRDEHYNFNTNNATDPTQQHQRQEWAPPTEFVSADANVSSMRAHDNYYDVMWEASCNQMKANRPAITLAHANIPTDVQTVERLMQFVDIFKMHGRSGKELFEHSMAVVNAVANGHYVEDVFDREFFHRFKVPREHKAAWLKKIADCKFNCFACNYCDRLWAQFAGLQPAATAATVPLTVGGDALAAAGVIGAPVV
jgi:hypothetical protein